MYIFTSLVCAFFMLWHIYNLHYTNCTHLDQFYIQCEWHNELVYVVNSSWNCCSLETLIGLANVILTCLQQCSWPTCHFSSDYDTCSGISNHYMSSESESCLPKPLVRSDLWGKFFAAELWLQTPFFTKLHANCDHYLTVWMCSSCKNPACQRYRQMASLSIQLQSLVTSPLESFLQPCSFLHDYANFHLTSVFPS